jgi:hypothetical protein
MLSLGSDSVLVTDAEQRARGVLTLRRAAG